MSSNYTGTPTGTQAPDGAPALNTYPVVQIPADGDPLAASSVQQPPKDLANRIAYIQDKMQMYGTGVDGSVTFDGTTTILGMVPSSNTYTMTRDINCVNVTVNTGVTILTAGFRIRCTGTFTASGTAALNCSASGVTPGGQNGTFGSGVPGGAAGIAGANVYGLGGNGGAGGGGGAGSTVSTTAAWDWKAQPFLSTGYAMLYSAGVPALSGIRGGGGGGGGANGGGTGGAGGSGGGVVFVAARTVNATFSSQVFGGTGANGVGGSAQGGGGGGGGAVVVVYGTKTSLAVTITATQGNGGTGPGGNGTAGTAGNTTVIEIVQA